MNEFWTGQVFGFISGLLISYIFYAMQTKQTRKKDIEDKEFLENKNAELLSRLNESQETAYRLKNDLALTTEKLSNSLKKISEDNKVTNQQNQDDISIILGILKSDGSNTEDELFNLGYDYYAQGNLKQLALLIESNKLKTLRDSKKNFLYGCSNRLEEKFEAAINCFKKSVDDEPDYLPPLYNIADIYFNFLENYSLAYEYYKRLIGLNGDNRVYAFNICQCLLKLELYDLNIQTALSFLEVFPKDPYIHRNLANAYIRIKKYAEAREYYLKAIEYGDMDTSIWNNLGIIYSELGDLDNTIRCYNHALKLDSSCLPPYIQLSNIYNVQKNYIIQEGILRIGIENCPNPIVLLVYLAKSLNLQHRNKEAYELIETIDIKLFCAEVKNDLASAMLLDICDIYFAHNKYEKIEELLNLSILKNIKNAESYVKLAYIYYYHKNHNYENALEILKQGHSLGSKSELLFILIGNILIYDYADNSAALEYLNEGIDIHQNNSQIINLRNIAISNINNGGQILYNIKL